MHWRVFPFKNYLTIQLTFNVGFFLLKSYTASYFCIQSSWIILVHPLTLNSYYFQYLIFYTEQGVSTYLITKHLVLCENLNKSMINTIKFGCILPHKMKITPQILHCKSLKNCTQKNWFNVISVNIVKLVDEHHSKE